MLRGTARLLLFAALAALIVGFFALDLGEYLRLEYVKKQQFALEALVREHPLAAAGAYFALYVAVAGLSLPGAAILSLVGGAVFGLLWGTVIVSFASSIGATLAFLASRFLLRGWVRHRFGASLAAVDAGVEREGAFYLFTLRLVPAFPFFAINLLMGLTALPTWTFYWVSQLGMLAGTVVYVNAGTQLAAIDSLHAIVSPGLLWAFALLGLLPLMAKKVVDAARVRRVYAPWAGRRPHRFDRNLVVIGAGSAGLVAAYVAAALKAKVTLVEKGRMGGDCLNSGCVPSKALIKSARVVREIGRHRDYGLHSARVDFELGDIMARVQRAIRAIEPHDSVERYTRLGVECVQGEARIVTPWEVEVRKTDGSSTRLTTRAIVIAAGARPIVPAIPGIEGVRYVTSDSVWSLTELPRRVAVLGGGAIGCELAQAFARLGAQVTQIELLPRLLAREDPEVSEILADRFTREGIELRLGHRVRELTVAGGEQALLVDRDGREARIGFDLLVCAVGRAPRLEGYGLETLGLEVGPGGALQTNEFLQTTYPNIFACGDVVGPYQFTHTAAHQAWYAAANALFWPLRRMRVDNSAVPWATFTDPEVARVGLNETQAKERGIAYEAVTYPMAQLDRAIIDEEAHGFVKVLTPPGRDRILGATIVGAHAGELIAEYVLAMRHGLGLNDVLRTIHVYPTLAEANKYAAGVWRRSRVTRGQHAAIEAFQDWMRGTSGLGAVLWRLLAAPRDRRPAYQPEHR